MDLYDSDRGLRDNSTKYCDSTLQHLKGHEDSEENLFFNISAREDVMFTASTCNFQTNPVEVGKERKKLDQLHNINDARFRNCGKSDVHDSMNCSQQFVLDNSIESIFSSKAEDLNYCSGQNSANNLNINSKPALHDMISKVTSESDQEDLSNVYCPICQKRIEITNRLNTDLIVNSHVDSCLNNSFVSDLSDSGQYKNSICAESSHNSRSNKRLHVGNSPNKRLNQAVKSKVTTVNSILNYMVPKNLKK